jgi:hypothetical protein
MMDGYSPEFWRKIVPSSPMRYATLPDKAVPSKLQEGVRYFRGTSAMKIYRWRPKPPQ